jgi:hypothetical protein
VKYLIEADKRHPGHLFWVVAAPETGRRQRLAGYPLESLALKDLAEREADQRKAERRAANRQTFAPKEGQ